jgi:CheY-like chemotaxis protein
MAMKPSFKHANGDFFRSLLVVRGNSGKLNGRRTGVLSFFDNRPSLRSIRGISDECVLRAMAGSTKAELKIADLARLSVFIVDDSEHMRVLIQRLLARLGVQRIQEYADPSEALSELRFRKPNLIFTDLSMTPMDGLDLARAVRRRPSESESKIPIIMVTGHTERHHIEAARDAGVNEILAKPITLGGLIQRIEEIVVRPRPFIRCATYVGPCRRRHMNPNHAGPWRRKDDQDVFVIDTEQTSTVDLESVQPAKRLAT